MGRAQVDAHGSLPPQPFVPVLTERGETTASDFLRRWNGANPERQERDKEKHRPAMRSRLTAAPQDNLWSDR